MFIPWWGIVLIGITFLVAFAKVFQLSLRVETLDDMIRKLEGIEEEQEYHHPKEKRHESDMGDADGRG